MRINTKIMQTT